MTLWLGLLLLTNVAASSGGTMDAQSIHSPHIKELGLPNENERLSAPTGTYITQVETKIGADGKPAECNIIGKSASENADVAACARIMRAQFEPSRDAGGIARAGTWKGWVGSASLAPSAKGSAPPSNRFRTDYPLRAARTEREGSVTIAAKVSAEGRASSCEVVVSSGSNDLDEASCQQIIRYALFDRETDDSGQAVEYSFRTTIHWKLN